MPLVIGVLVALAVVSLPEPYRLRGWYLAVIVAVCAIVSAIGIFGGLRDADVKRYRSIFVISGRAD